MSEPGLIRDYLTILAADLPDRIVVELADGLAETYRRHLGQGLSQDEAAQAALTEFGDPQTIVAAFTEASHARRTARRLLVTGPAVGACWGIVLITARAWTWPVPIAARVLFGGIVMTVIGLLAIAVFGRHYRSVCRAAAAACLGAAVLDTAMLTAAVTAVHAAMWPVFPAAAVSLARLTFTARNFRHALAG